MADKSDCTSEDVSDAPELDPQIIKLKTALETEFTGVDLLFSMTDQIPTVLVPTESLHDLCIFLKTNEDYDSKMLSCMAGVDYVDYCQILYVLYSINKNCTVTTLLKTCVLIGKDVLFKIFFSNPTYD